MSYFLIATLIVAIVAVLYMWYATRNFHHIPDEEPLLLHTDEDKLAEAWYKHNTKQSIDFNVNDLEIAAKFLQRVCEIEVDPSLLVIGGNLQYQYNRITGNNLATKYNPETDCLFEIRSLIGKPGEIAIMHNQNIVARMRRNNNLDLSEVGAIMDNDLDVIARDYFIQLLKTRWEQLRELNDPKLLNTEGSYAYYKPDITGTDPIILFGNVTAASVPHDKSIARINLLCKDLEFETLLKRWRASLPMVAGDFA